MDPRLKVHGLPVEVENKLSKLLDRRLDIPMTMRAQA